jgi:hypothetical protein
MQRAGVLHGDEGIAFEHEAGHPHKHREDVVIERLGRVAEEPRPDISARAKAEGARHIEPRRANELHQATALEAQDAPLTVAAQRHRDREPVADHLQLGIVVEARLELL